VKRRKGFDWIQGEVKRIKCVLIGWVVNKIPLVTYSVDINNYKYSIVIRPDAYIMADI
jgi:hypothetical protein